MASINVAVWSTEDGGKTWIRKREYDTLDNAISYYSFYAYQYDPEDADDTRRFRKDYNLECSLVDAQFILKSKIRQLSKDIHESLEYYGDFTLPGDYKTFKVTDADKGPPTSD